MQLLLTLFCLPILTSWGLAIPVLTVVGNLFFIPFLSVFIALGICILCSWGIHADVRLFCYALNTVATLWIWLLSLAPIGWNIVVPQRLFLLTLLGPIVALILIRHRWSAQYNIRQIIGALAYIAVLSVITYAVCHFCPTTTHIKRAQVGTSIFWDGYKAVLIDWGSLNAVPGGLSWAQYQLLPALYNATGASSIDTLILTHRVKKVQTALQAVARRCTINTIIVPDQVSKKILENAHIAKKITAITPPSSMVIPLSNQCICITTAAASRSKRLLDVFSKKDFTLLEIHSAFKACVFNSS